MNPRDAVAEALAPWQGAAQALQAWLGGSGPALARLQSALQALARGEAAVQAELAGVPVRPSPDAVDQRLHARKRRRAARPVGFNELRARREGVLRLAAWRALERWGARASAAGRGAQALDDLLQALADNPRDLPPGIGPTLAYAGGPLALPFFNDQIRSALLVLAERHPAAAAAFNALAATEPFEASGVAVQRWSRAWTVAVSASYLDWLKEHADQQLERALHTLWAGEADVVRFKALAGLAVLPTAERSLHADLWTAYVPAQVLAYDAARRPGGWHRIEVAMHDLGARDAGASSEGTRQTLYRGWGVEMLYQTVFADAAQRVQADEAAPALPPAIVVELPPLCPGQQQNLQLVLRWQEGPPVDAQRFAGPPPVPGLSAEQQHLLQAWREARPQAGAHAVAPATLAWQPAEDDGALGSAALWAVAGESAQWLQLDLVAHWQGRWQRVPLALDDEGARSTLAIAEDADLPPGLTTTLLRHALAQPDATCWACRSAGVGAFVLAAVDFSRLPHATR